MHACPPPTCAVSLSLLSITTCLASYPASWPNAEVMDKNVVASQASRLTQFAIVPDMLAALRPLDITARIYNLDRTVVSAGAFGDVSRAEYNIDKRRRVKVAIKRLRIHVNDEIRILLEKEVYVWSKLKHENVLPLLGYAFDRDTGYPMLVSEWMQNGTAGTFVRSHPDCDLLRLITGIARGIAYLHGNNIIHSDIKPDNVLVSEHGEALICDFGYSRMIDASKSLGNLSTGVNGTAQYLAYELLAKSDIYDKHSKESDAWSFGVTVYELYTREHPYGKRPQPYIVYQIMEGKTLQFPSNPVSPHESITDELRDICTKCWILDPTQRIRMDDVLGILEAKLSSRPSLSNSSDQIPSSQRPDWEDHLTYSPDSEMLISTPSDSLPLIQSRRPEEHRASKRPIDDEDMQIGRYSNTNCSNGELHNFFRTDCPSPASCEFYPESGPVITSPLPPPPVSGTIPYLPRVAPSTSDGIFLDDLDPETLPPEFKKQGSDWYAVFNPKLKRVLDVDLTHTLNHESVICCVRFSADGRYLATGCNRTAQIYDTKTGQKICVLNHENASPIGDLYIWSVCFSLDCALLVTGAEDRTIRYLVDLNNNKATVDPVPQIWDIDKKSVKHVLDGRQGEIYALDFSRNGRFIVSGSEDGTARIWDLEAGVQKVLEMNEPDGVDTGVTCVAFSPDGRLVAAGSFDTAVRIWDVQSGTLVNKYEGHTDCVYSVAFTPDGRGIISGSMDRTLKHWDISAIVNGSNQEDGLPTTPLFALGNASGNKNTDYRANDGAERGRVNTLDFIGHKNYVLHVAVSHDGQWVVSGSKDRSVRFWDASTAQVQLMLQGHKDSVIAIDLSPAGGMLATGSADMQARIWRYTTI